MWPVPGVLAAVGIGLKGGMKVKVKTAMTGMALPGMATITVLSLAHAHTAQYSTVYVPPGSSAPSMSDPDTPARVILPAARLSSDPKVLPHVTVKAPVRRPFAAAPLPAPLPAPAPAPVPVSAPAAAVSSQTQVASSQSSQSSQQSDSSPWQAHGRHAARDSGDGNSGYQGRHGDNGNGSNYWQDGSQQNDTWQSGQQQGGEDSSQSAPCRSGGTCGYARDGSGGGARTCGHVYGDARGYVRTDAGGHCRTGHCRARGHAYDSRAAIILTQPISLR